MSGDFKWLYGATLACSITSEPFKPKPLHVDNGFHDDDGREHEPQHTRREAVYTEDLRRDDPPDQEENSEIL